MEGLLSPPSPPFHGREGEGSRTAPLHSQLNSRIEFDRNPNPEAGHCAAALSPPARSGRNQWCPISPATPLVPSPLDRDGAARHLCPISAFGINLGPSAGRAGGPLPAAIANPRVRIYHGGAHGAPHLSHSCQELLYWRAHFLMAPQPLGWELGQWILN